MPSSVVSIEARAFEWSDLQYAPGNTIIFYGRTLAEVQAMANYPWGIYDTSKISVA